MEIDINRLQATSKASPEDPKGCNLASGPNLRSEVSLDGRLTLSRTSNMMSSTLSAQNLTYFC